jgi:hypothetical protein
MQLDQNSHGVSAIRSNSSRVYQRDDSLHVQPTFSDELRTLLISRLQALRDRVKRWERALCCTTRRGSELYDIHRVTE